MIQRIKRFFSLLKEIDDLRHDLKKESRFVEELLVQRQLMYNRVSEMRQEFEGKVQEVIESFGNENSAAQVTIQSLKKDIEFLRGIIKTEAGETASIRQFFDKDTNEIVNQRIYETREKKR